MVSLLILLGAPLHHQSATTITTEEDNSTKHRRHSLFSVYTDAADVVPVVLVLQFHFFLNSMPGTCSFLFTFDVQVGCNVCWSASAAVPNATNRCCPVKPELRNGTTALLLSVGCPIILPIICQVVPV